jgi:hypothetical protein
LYQLSCYPKKQLIFNNAIIQLIATFYLAYHFKIFNGNDESFVEIVEISFTKAKPIFGLSF